MRDTYHRYRALQQGSSASPWSRRCGGSLPHDDLQQRRPTLIRQDVRDRHSAGCHPVLLRACCPLYSSRRCCARLLHAVIRPAAITPSGEPHGAPLAVLAWPSTVESLCEAR